MPALHESISSTITKEIEAHQNVQVTVIQWRFVHKENRKTAIEKSTWEHVARSTISSCLFAVSLHTEQRSNTNMGGCKRFRQSLRMISNNKRTDRSEVVSDREKLQSAGCSLVITVSEIGRNPFWKRQRDNRLSCCPLSPLLTALSAWQEALNYLLTFHQIWCLQITDEKIPV